ncbi:hypothetical protein, partial [Phocaeicola vulgatus]|uniref:hypothetical protein n=1 Tax=Phocaeicola vulgatus TaxID=821 RepID=UPI001C7050B7
TGILAHFSISIYISLLSEAFQLSLPGEILHADQTAGKGREGKQTAGDFTEYPTRQAQQGGN